MSNEKKSPAYLKAVINVSLNTLFLSHNETELCASRYVKDFVDIIYRPLQLTTRTSDSAMQSEFYSTECLAVYLTKPVIFA